MILSPADRDTLLFKAARDRRLQRVSMAIPVLLVMLDRLDTERAHVFEIGRIASRLNSNRSKIRETVDRLVRAEIIVLTKRDHRGRGLYQLNAGYDPPITAARRKGACNRPPSLGSPLPGTAA